MNLETDLEAIEAFVLVGGFGTRLQSVLSPNTPKALAPILGRPFLWHLLSWLRAREIREAVLGTGYLASEFESHAVDIAPAGMRVRLSEENEPMGTAGAIYHARRFLTSDPVLVMNGDSFCPADLGALLRFHRENRSLATVLLTHVEDVSRYGSVTVDDRNRIESFREKSEAGGPGYINAGTYLLSQEALDLLPSSVPSSIEREVLPEWVGNRLHAYLTDTPFIDIGTPESYQSAEAFFEREY